MFPQMVKMQLFDDTVTTQGQKEVESTENVSSYLL